MIKLEKNKPRCKQSIEHSRNRKETAINGIIKCLRAYVAYCFKEKAM